MRFIIADADFLPEMAADIRYTPTFAFYQRGKRVRANAPVASRRFAYRAAAQVDEFVGTNERMLRDRVWLHASK